MKVANEADPIWGDVAEIEGGVFDGWSVTSHRTDGTYRIARSVIEEVRQLDARAKARLTTWIVDQHQAGEAEPLVNSDVIARILDRPNLKFRHRVNRFFHLLRSADFGVGRVIRISGLVDDTQRYWTGRLSAWLEVSEAPQLPHLMNAFQQEGLIAKEGDFFRLTAEGLRRLDDLGTSAGTTQAFVAMWFSKELDEAYTLGFEPAILDNGYDPLRIDKKEHINKIDDEIIAEIRRSKFIVADFSSELIVQGKRTILVPRGGVYYEAGFAQGIGIPVIWTVREDCIEHVHFDTRQYSHVVWSNPAELRDKLTNRIGAVIGPRTVNL